MFQIPPGDDNHKVAAQHCRCRSMRTVLAFFPHAHLRGKAAKYELKTPDGKTDEAARRAALRLQLAVAVPLRRRRCAAPRGSTLIYTAWYDNSDKNPANPDPKKHGALGAADLRGDAPRLSGVRGRGRQRETGAVEPARLARRQPADGCQVPKEGVVIPEQFKRVFMQYDNNNDGKLDQKEFDSLPPFLQNAVADYIRNLKP